MLDIKGKLDKISLDRLKIAYLSFEALNNEMLLGTSLLQPTTLFASNKASCDNMPTTITDQNSPDSPETLSIMSRVGRSICRSAYLKNYVLQQCVVFA